MTVFVLFSMFFLGTYGLEEGKKDCAMNKYEYGCEVIQGQEYCKPVWKEWCVGYKDGDFNYRKEM